MGSNFRMKNAHGSDTGIALRTATTPADVWHCSLSLRADEGQLSDEKWGAIAQDFVDRMGFTEASGKAECRWVAVRHGLSTNGNDHIHIAVSLVREDGTKASTHNDFKKAQDTCRDLEREYGLKQLSSREHGLGERGIKPAEQERARRTGAVEVDAHRLERAVRAAAAASLDEGEFVRRVRRAGVLIRPRFAAGRDDVVAGYSVAVRTKHGTAPVWYGGGRLARDLTLPRLREGWPDSPLSAQSAVDEWKATSRNPWQYRPVAPGREEHEPAPAMWQQYSKEVRQLREQLRSIPVEDRAAWAHVARDAAGAFAAWSQRVETTPGPLAETSRELARSAQIKAHTSKPKKVSMGSAGGAAMLLMQAASQGQGTMAEAILMRQLARLTVAIIDMHKAIGDEACAAQISRTLNTQMATVASRLPEVPRKGQTGPATDVDERAPESVRIAQTGLSAPRPGSPLPTKVEPAKLYKPATGPDQDRGIGR
ncbi:relaxase/mobilization nuclease domain-containing protein [Leifsonia virtsii]|uniref:Relaxase/mobilization nuclease domain-containing protein n=1 Tax=Leifsonia virtsii TaxID=3035915 RepID=A0ABT8J2K7_9MICO|nr:relaxase/mobilization nuclease domain-containing protein [Leifsonia virtsii]MDN4599314.1 relaxase/mobilization nuclease domain-containing protein [Leifsonia virtsii]